MHWLDSLGNSTAIVNLHVQDLYHLNPSFDQIFPEIISDFITLGSSNLILLLCWKRKTKFSFQEWWPEINREWHVVL
jgi:hypothetical protein